MALLGIVFIFPAHAFAPLALLVPWFITGTNLMVADLVVGITGLLTSVVWYDCNKFALSAPCNSGSSSINPGSVNAIFKDRALEVRLQPDAKRENPDPAKFNDPTSGSRDVTPKQTVVGEEGGSTTDSNLVAGGTSVSFMSNTRKASSLASAKARYEAIANESTGALHYYLTNCSNTTGSTTCEVWKVWTDWHAADIPAAYTGSIASFGAPTAYTGPDCAGTLEFGECVGNPPGVSTCPAGYANSSGTCTLTDAAQVKKPITTPCQVLYDAASKSMLFDSANPNCDGASDLVSNGKFTVPSTADTSSVTVATNGDNGFDVSKTDGQGTTMTIHTGPYDGVGGGYPITSSTSTKPTGSDPDGTGDGCGIAGKPICSVATSIDSQMSGADGYARTGVSEGNNALKSKLDGIDDDKFKWTIIPQIPTAECVNPSVKNPLTSQMVEMDICGGFNKFAFFLKAVLAVLCLYGCARQIETAMKS